MNSSVRLK